MRSGVFPVSPVNPVHHPLPPSPPTALHPQSRLTSVSYNLVPHSNPGVCKKKKRGGVGRKGNRAGILAHGACMSRSWTGGTTVGIRPQNTPPHVVSIRNNLVFLPTTERKRLFFFTSVFSLCKPTRLEKKGEIHFHICS